LLRETQQQQQLGAIGLGILDPLLLDDKMALDMIEKSNSSNGLFGNMSSSMQEYENFQYHVPTIPPERDALKTMQTLREAEIYAMSDSEDESVECAARSVSMFTGILTL
jgi:hypothetical protein